MVNTDAGLGSARLLDAHSPEMTRRLDQRMMPWLNFRLWLALRGPFRIPAEIWMGQAIQVEGGGEPTHGLHTVGRSDRVLGVSSSNVECVSSVVARHALLDRQQLGVLQVARRHICWWTRGLSLEPQLSHRTVLKFVPGPASVAARWPVANGSMWNRSHAPLRIT